MLLPPEIKEIEADLGHGQAERSRRWRSDKRVLLLGRKSHEARLAKLCKGFDIVRHARQMNQLISQG